MPHNLSHHLLQAYNMVDIKSIFLSFVCTKKIVQQSILIVFPNSSSNYFWFFFFFTAEVLQKLFEDLHFKVDVHTDLNSSTLENLFLTTHLIDHSDYDAFVCCILTHGKLGVVYTSDGKAVEILSLVDFFSDRQCSSLKGKPKLFFIQACQRG